LQLVFFSYSCYQVNLEFSESTLKNYSNLCLRVVSGGWVSLVISTLIARCYDFSWKQYFRFCDAEQMQKFSCDTWEHVQVGQFSTGVVSASKPTFMTAVEVSAAYSQPQPAEEHPLDSLILFLSMPMVPVCTCLVLGQGLRGQPPTFGWRLCFMVPLSV